MKQINDDIIDRAIERITKLESTIAKLRQCLEMANDCFGDCEGYWNGHTNECESYRKLRAECLGEK